MGTFAQDFATDQQLAALADDTVSTGANTGLATYVDAIGNTKNLYEYQVYAINTAGETQPLDPLWNPAGYMRNVVEAVRVTAA